ncbi:MAG: FtsB family cell division protein [Ilumatobacteraceae bacterium]
MSAGRVSTVTKPPGRRASDAGRSRLADYTRPIAREQRITRSRRPAFAAGLVALLVVVTIGAALFGLPLRTWFAQDDELSQLEVELDELAAVNADLSDEVARLQTDDGIVEAARESLGVTRFGERRQTVIGATELPTDLPDGWPYAAVERMIALRAEEP